VAASNVLPESIRARRWGRGVRLSARHLSPSYLGLVRVVRVVFTELAQLLFGGSTGARGTTMTGGSVGT
jgi:hypothetical protein